MDRRVFIVRGIAAAGSVLSLALTGCSVDTSVQTTASTPNRVQHAYVTVVAVWLNASSTATVSDAGWAQSTLATPQTIDLTTLNAGAVADLVSSLKMTAGTVSQVRLVLADSSATLESSAQAAGLTTNDALVYTDSSGTVQTIPLEFASPASSFVVPTSLTLQGQSAGSFLNQTSTSTTTATDTSNTAAASVAVNIDGVRNLLLFNSGNQVGALLTPALSAANVSDAGAISGTLDLSALPSNSLSNYQGVVVTAEAVSSDGTRFVPVKSSSVTSDGTFVLYPLPVSSSGNTTYDLVIHGVAAQSVVITQVPVNAGDPSTATTVQSSAITLTPASNYAVNVARNSTPLPGGTQVDFYQTLATGAVPYLMEWSLINPFSGGFAYDVALSSASVAIGAYNSGNAISFTTVRPLEGIRGYQLVSEGTLRAASALNTGAVGTLLQGSSSSSVLPIVPPAPGIASGGTIGTLSGTVTVGSPGRYDTGVVLVSQGGQLVDSLNISTALAAGARSLTFSDPSIPAGLPLAVYDVSVRAWKSNSTSATLARIGLANQVDMRQSNAATVTIPLP
jgi:Domain of unknown function (DUF4382)